jgi:long-chain acyl-CoA synthetase
MAQASIQVENLKGATLTQMFAKSVKEHAKQAALRAKKGDRWVDTSYAEMKTLVHQVAAGLASLGIKKSDKAALYSRNRPEWALADWGILHIGAVSVPIYDTLTAEKAEYILRDSVSKVVFVEGVEHLNKIRSVRRRLPQLDTVVLFDEVFEKTLEEGEVLFSDLLRKGKEALAKKPNLVEDAASKVKADDWASIVYTSGTTGDPKGAILTHNNFASNILTVVQILPIRPGYVALSFLPLSHTFERMGGHFTMTHIGATIAYSESIEKLPENMMEIKPHIMLSVPRLYEKLFARISQKVANDSFIKRKIFAWALKVGKQRLHEKYTLKVVNPSTEKKFRRADKLVFSKIRERTGGRLAFFVSGGAPLSKEIEEFFNAVNLPIMQGYGLTETSPVLSANTFDNFRLGSVGHPIPGAEIKIAEDGEILARGPMIFKGYHNKPTDTKECFTPDGYFKTGDIGKIDEDGFLFITDRKKELIVMSNGKKVAPQPIENLLKTKPGIAHAVLIGDDKKYISVLLAPDLEGLKQRAQADGTKFENAAEILAKEDVQALFKDAVEAVNKDLSRYEQIKRYKVLDREFTLEGGELTPTLKVKRRIVADKYKAEIAALYTGGSDDS